jgi:hypothetical protein
MQFPQQEKLGKVGHLPRLSGLEFLLPQELDGLEFFPSQGSWMG